MALTVAQLVKAYVQLWDKKEVVEARHKNELRPIKNKMDTVQAALQKLFEEQGVQNQSVVGSGTAYRTTWTSAKVKDWPETLEWIKKHERWDMLTHAINKTAVLEEMKVYDENGEEVGDRPCPVPGVQIEKGWKVNVRRS